MTVLEKYVQELSIDATLEELNLKDAALTLPAKKAKWVSRLMIEKTNLNKLYKKKGDAVKMAVEQIKAESPIKLNQPTLERAAEKHPAVITVDTEITEQKSVIDFLERVEKTIHSISFDVKNLIELIKMETS